MKKAPITVQNTTRATTLVSEGRVANWFWTRLRGLIGHAPLQPGQGLLIVPGHSIHTHFMGFAIDVVYVNRSQEVVGIDAAIPPWRLGGHYRGARYVLELPPGTAQATGTQVGDRLRVEGCRT
jgi:uncharacterized protein